MYQKKVHLLYIMRRTGSQVIPGKRENWHITYTSYILASNTQQKYVLDQYGAIQSTKI